MNREQFFQDVDRQLADQSAKSVEKSERAKELDKIRDKIFTEARPLIEQYAADLRGRGIKVDFNPASPGLHFQINIPSGGHRGFMVRDGKFINLFTEKGQRYTSEGGGPPLDEKWSMEEFEKYLQKCISDFMYSHIRKSG